MATSQPDVVVITGASAGVGRATARAFARRGARIALLARGLEGLAFHDRRELEVGMPTVMAVEGNKVLAGSMDRYLARTGYDAQQTDEPIEPNRQDNLWKPVPGDRGAHGDFGNRASTFSAHLWVNTHRGWLALGAGVAALAYAAFARRSRTDHSRFST